MYPTLVEPSIKHVIMSELKASRGNKVQRNTLLLNGLGFLFLGSTIAFILWLQYKGKQDVRAQVEREQKKREYILSKLQMYQRMKAKEYTNIPI
jgi:hypothetical protein